MSIWEGIHRSRFETDLDVLYRRGRFQEQSLFPALPASSCGRVTRSEVQSVVLDNATESQLAEDFAVLASVTNWPGDVTAAALQLNTSPDRLRVSIAANAGISQQAELHLRDLLRVLELRARHGLKRQVALEYFLDGVVRIHKYQVFGRLNSWRAEGQKKREKDVSEKLDSLITDLEKKIMLKAAADNKTSKLFEQLEELRSFLRAAESAESGSVEEHSSIKHLIRVAADLTTTRESLAVRLQQAGFVNINDRSRVVREIQAIGNYHRISSYAVEASWTYKRLFQNIDLNVVKPDPRLGPYNREKFYVHAEIQLLIDFEVGNADRPRYIGASKKPCFLCYCFIRAFRPYVVYGIGRSHGEVFKHWTVPENEALGFDARKHINGALEQTAEDIRNAPRFPRSPKPSRWSFHPLQSNSKLLLSQLKNYSNSTVVSVVSVPKEKPPRLFEHVSSALAEKVLIVDFDGEIRPTEAGSHNEEGEHESSSFEHASVDKIDKLKAFESNITADTLPTYCDDKLELFFELESSPSAPQKSNGVAAVQTQIGSCRVRTVAESLDCPTDMIDVTRLEKGPVTLKKEEDSASVTFILKLEHVDYEVELQWL